MEKEREDILIWKDIATADPHELERFLACLKFLFIMPPKHLHNDDKGKGKWIITTRGKETNYYPQCRYDEFIASHASSCEHSTRFFAYYHRHLMSMYSLALN